MIRELSDAEKTVIADIIDLITIDIQKQIDENVNISIAVRSSIQNIKQTDIYKNAIRNNIFSEKTFSDKIEKMFIREVRNIDSNVNKENRKISFLLIEKIKLFIKKIKFRYIAYPLVITIIILIFLNPSNHDFSEKIPTISSFTKYSKTKENCLTYGREANFLIFSIYEVTNTCDESRTGKIKKIYEEDFFTKKRYLGFLKNFYELDK